MQGTDLTWKKQLKAVCSLPTTNFMGGIVFGPPCCGKKQVILHGHFWVGITGLKNSWLEVPTNWVGLG